MKLSHFACTAVILLGMAHSAAAQGAEPTGTGGNTASTPGVVATIDVSRLPVVDEAGAVVGVISRADVVRALAEEW